MVETLRKLYFEKSRRLDKPTKKLLKNSGWVAISGIGATVLATVQSIIAVRLMGVEAYGLLALISAITGFVFQFADFRTWEVGIRFLPERIKSEDCHGVLELSISLLLLDVLSGFIAVLVTFFLREWLAQSIAHNLALVPLLGIYALSLPMMQISYGTCVGVLRTFDKFNIISIKVFAFTLLQLIVVTVVLILKKDMETVIISIVACEILHALASLALTYGALRQNSILLSQNKWINPLKPIWKLRSFITQVWLSGTIQGVQTRVDVLVLGALATPASVGYYRVALDLANVLSKLGNPIQNAILPVFVEIAQTGDWKKVKSLTIKTTAVLSGALVPPLIAVILFAPNIIQIFVGPGLDKVALPFVILTIGITINTILIWARPLLITKSRIARANQAAVLGFLLEIVLFWLLVRPYEETGVAVARAVMYGSTALISAWFAVMNVQTAKRAKDENIVSDD